MQIDNDILIAYGAVAKKYEKGELIFRESTMPHFFYQIVDGSVKLFSSNDEGKELIQGVFESGQSFGEPPLLIEKPYPSTAQAASNCVVLKIRREKILNILKDYPEINNCLLYTLANRIYQKASAGQIWVSNTPEEKILRFLNNRLKKAEPDAKICVPYTRQQIADFTGLRVETVIRTLLRMKRAGKVQIVDHKIYY